MPAEHRRRAWRWWDDYGAGITEPDDPRLMPVPSIAGRGCLLHWAAAAVFRALADEWLREYPHSPGLLVQSGWRPVKPWQRNRAAYFAELIRRYRPRLPAATDDELIAYGQVRLAMRSAHQTGLALDLGSPPPMRPDSRRMPVTRMRQSAIYGWLMARGPERGLRNYLPEPWHWELPLPREAWEAQGPEG